MVKFEILESLNWRGGSHYCYVYAEQTQDVVDALKDAWYESGVHRNGGELFLDVILVGSDGNARNLSLGSCGLDDDGKLSSSFEFPYDQIEKKQWYEFGLFIDEYDGDSFEAIIELLLEVDSPDRVLGAYLYKVSDELASNNQTIDGKVGDNVLANILAFSVDHKKLIPMYSWLASSAGEEYLLGNELFQPLGHNLLKSLSHLRPEDIETFYMKHIKKFKSTIFLPSLRK